VPTTVGYVVPPITGKLALYMYPPPPPPPPMPAPPPPPAITSTSTLPEYGATNELEPVLVKVCILYPPTVVTIPPVASVDPLLAATDPSTVTQTPPEYISTLLVVVFVLTSPLVGVGRCAVVPAANFTNPVSLIVKFFNVAMLSSIPYNNYARSAGSASGRIWMVGGTASTTSICYPRL
jgi:hypothetical protein